MIDQQRPIEPPPSIDDILNTSGRIGRVDFSQRVVPVPKPEHEPVEGAILAAVPPGVQHGVQDQLEDQVDDEAEPAADLDEHLEEVDSHELDDLEPPPAAFDPGHEPEPTLPRRQPPTQVPHLLSPVSTEDATTVTDDINDVVDGVIARIREAQHTTLVHLEAIEAEAVLRCDMLTAQAELDAELIRLHARREAHAIIAAARQRSGVIEPPAAENQRLRLDQLGEAAMRLAEEFGALTIDPGSPGSPHHPGSPDLRR